MKIEIIEVNNILIAEIVADTIVINNAQDALDIMANCGYLGADRLIIHEQNIAASFFDLKTRLAGDILQKFSNYNVSLAVVGDFSKYESNSLRDFIYESNKAGRINFVSSVEEAKQKLNGISI